MDGLQKTGLNITAYVIARVMRRDLQAEVTRLERQDRTRSMAEMAAVLSVLFALAIAAASFGWIGLGLYFLGALILFH